MKTARKNWADIKRRVRVIVRSLEGQEGTGGDVGEQGPARAGRGHEGCEDAVEDAAGASCLCWRLAPRKEGGKRPPKVLEGLKREKGL